MKRILLVIKSDGIGGVERHVSRLLDAFEQRAVQWDLVALSASRVPNGVLADRGVRVLESRFSWAPLRRVHQFLQLRSTLRRQPYDVVVAFGPSPNALVSLTRSRRTLTVISEHGNPFVAHRRWWNATMMWTYRRADALIVLTERLAEDLRTRGAVPRTVAVSRYTLSDAIPMVPSSTPRSPMIVSVGRLVPSKRVGDLIEAFAAVASRFPRWTLTIVGDGSERAALSAHVSARGLDGRVVFTGFVQEPWREMATSSLFVLSSAHEGFSYVLIEAAASGCAIISSDCRYGPREILNHGERGLLYPVGDVEQLTACLVRLMEDEALRRRLAEHAHASVTRYRTDTADHPWIDLLTSLATGTRA